MHLQSTYVGWAIERRWRKTDIVKPDCCVYYKTQKYQELLIGSGLVSICLHFYKITKQLFNVNLNIILAIRAWYTTIRIRSQLQNNCSILFTVDKNFKV